MIRSLLRVLFLLTGCLVLSPSTWAGAQTTKVLVAEQGLTSGAGVERGPPNRPTGGPTPARTPTRPVPAAKSGKVNLRVFVVHATDSHSRSDSRLGSLSHQLRHLKYSGMEVLDAHHVVLGAKGTETLSVAGGRKLTITLLSRDDKRVRMRVQITAKGSKLLDTTMSVNRNGTVIVAGPRHEGGILVLPITARY